MGQYRFDDHRIAQNNNGVTANMSLAKTLQNNYLVTLLTSFVLYYLAGKLGFMLSSGSGFAALVWPPAGISIVLLLYFGLRVWPGIYLGAVFSVIPDIGAFITDPRAVMQYPHILFVAAGATVQAYVAAWLVEKLGFFRHDFSDPKKITGFYLVVGPLCSVISATVASATFISFNMSSFNSAFEEWVLWYFADTSSAVIFTTLIFSFIKFKQKRQQLITSFIVIGLVFAYSILYLGKSWEDERLELIFSQKVIAATDTLDQFVAAHVSLDNNLMGFKNFRPKLNKDQFKQFADNNLLQNDNVRSLAWIEIVSDDQRAEFENELASIHGQDISLWQTGADLKPMPAQTATSYTVVKLIEPFERLNFVVGHVIGVDEGRNEAMQTAFLTGEATLTAPVVLVTGPTIPTAATIYRAHVSDGELDGYTAIAMRIDAMVGRLQGDDENHSFYVELYDKEAGPGLTFKSYTGEDVDIAGLKSQTIELPALNRTWVITFTRTPAFEEDNKTSQPLFIAIAGMIFASLMTVGIILISGQRIFLENIVMQRTKDLEKANQAKTEFMANMSHDLRTPLNAIIGFSEIMTNEMFGKLGSEKYVEYSSDINQSSEYLLSLINDILDLSAIDANQRMLDLKDVDLKDLVENCGRTLGPLIKGKNHTFITGIIGDFPKVYADFRSLKQILINLISNSIKFTPNGGTIKVDAEYSPSQVWITVSDSGQGIAKENLDSIFDPFNRVDNHPHLSQEGTGLGLAIVNSLVNLHGGILTIESEPGTGTQITVEMPRAQS